MEDTLQALKQAYAALTPVELAQHLTAAVQVLLEQRLVQHASVTADGKLVQIIDIPTLMPNGEVEMVRETLIEGEEFVKGGLRYVVAKNAKGALYRKNLEGQVGSNFGTVSPRVFAAQMNLAAVKQIEETTEAISGMFADTDVQAPESTTGA